MRMKDFPIHPYQPTTRLWHIIICVHVVLFIVAGISLPHRIARDAMIVEMYQSPLPTSSVQGSPSTQAAAVVTEEKVMPEAPPTSVPQEQVIPPKVPVDKKASVIVEKKTAEQKRKAPAATSKDTAKNKAHPQSTTKKSERLNALSVLESTGGSSMKNAIESELGVVGIDAAHFDTAIGQLKKHITAFWVLPSLPPRGSFVTLHIRLNARGEVMSVKKIASSGNSALDASAQRAIEDASPFPMPQDTMLRDSFMDMELTLRPEE